MSGRPQMLAALAAAMAVAGLAAADPASDPPVPVGRDPGGPLVALITTGVDYTLPELARRLARDGEGEIIGWDFVDDDRRPYAHELDPVPKSLGGNGTALALNLIAEGEIRLLPVRVDPSAPETLAAAVAFIAKTPARLALLPFATEEHENWSQFSEAAARAAGVLFIVPAGDDGVDIDISPRYPAGLGLANALVVTAPLPADADPQSTPNIGSIGIDALVSAMGALLAPDGSVIRSPQTSREAAVVVVDAIAGCRPAMLKRYRGVELKAALLEEVRGSFPAGGLPVVEPCIRRGPTVGTRR